MEAIPIITRALERVCKEARGSRHEELREACAGTLVRLKEAEAAGLKASADEHFEPFRLAMASQHAGAQSLLAMLACRDAGPRRQPARHARVTRRSRRVGPHFRFIFRRL